jgi:hypothetical protein
MRLRQILVRYRIRAMCHECLYLQDSVVVRYRAEGMPTYVE